MKELPFHVCPKWVGTVKPDSLATVSRNTYFILVLQFLLLAIVVVDLTLANY